jgi:hypothetical protein
MNRIARREEVKHRSAGTHGDRRTKRLRTRAAQKRAALKEHAA